MWWDGVLDWHNFKFKVDTKHGSLSYKHSEDDPSRYAVWITSRHSTTVGHRPSAFENFTISIIQITNVRI